MVRGGRGGGAVWGLIGAIAAAHGLLMLRPAWRGPAEFYFGVIPLRFAGAGAEGFANPLEAMGPLFGAVFLHGGLLHLGMNMLVLAQVGPLVAHRLGAVRFLLLFFGCAAASALVYVAVNVGSPAPAIGASGAVSGVFSAYLFALRPDWREALRERRVLLAGFWFLAINVGLAFLAARSGVLPIAWEAHLGGFLGGLALYPLLSNPPGPGRASSSV